jgi:hypothetical protein
VAKITKEEFLKYYDSAVYSAKLRPPRAGPNLAVINTARINNDVPYGQNVHAIALDLLVDRNAANLVRHEVFCRAITQTYNFSVADVWKGNARWEGLQNLTIAVALDILCLPKVDNPLSLPLIGGMQLIDEINCRWWGMLALTLRLRGLFELQVGCFTVLKTPIHEIARCLSKMESEIQPLYQTTTNEINDAIDQWVHTEIAAANARLAEVEVLKERYNSGEVL